MAYTLIAAYTKFEKQLVAKYTFSLQYRNYIESYYIVFACAIISHALNKNLPLHTLEKEIDDLIKQTFDAMMVEKAGDFPSLNKVFLNALEQVLNYRFGKHSSEYAKGQVAIALTRIIMEEIESLPIQQRTPFRICYIHVSGGYTLWKVYRFSISLLPIIKGNISERLILRKKEALTFFSIISEFRDNLAREKGFLKSKLIWIWESFLLRISKPFKKRKKN